MGKVLARDFLVCVAHPPVSATLCAACSTRIQDGVGERGIVQIGVPMSGVGSGQCPELEICRYERLRLAKMSGSGSLEHQLMRQLAACGYFYLLRDGQAVHVADGRWCSRVGSVEVSRLCPVSGNFRWAKVRWCYPSALWQTPERLFANWPYERICHE